MLVDDADTFSNRPVLPFFVELAKKRGGKRNENISTVLHGPHWRALRCNITAETLHPSRLGLGHLAPLQREAIQDLVATLQSAGAGAGLRDHLRAAVFRVIARLCFGEGVNGCHVHGLQVAIGEVNPFTGPSMLAKLAEWRYQRQLLAFHARISELCLPLISARRRRPRDDDLCRPYIDTLIQLRVPEGKHGGRRALGDDEIVDLVLEFLGAGSGSLVVCLEWTLAHLIVQPEVQKKLRREVDGEAVVPPDRSQLIRGMPYLHAVILESLRMHPPAPVALRHVEAAEAATTLLGEDNDVTVLFLLGDMGRDRKAWKDPDEFRPERFLAGGDAEGVGPLPGRKETRMMPFGAGHRFCPGVGLAMATMKCFLAALVREFEWEPPTNAVVDLTELDGFLKTMKKPLSARLTPLRTAAASS
ncbi:hypothetical protein ZWY2020_031655 [Hordeum vulgare]|nr:hypothetical protein ZWY2020_031655 [Hordeum vulgare]